MKRLNTAEYCSNSIALGNYGPSYHSKKQIFWPLNGFPVMAKITRILAANICGQFFFVINTRYLVENFQLICYSQQVNATSQYNDSGSSRLSKWPNDGMVAWRNIAGSLYKE